MRPFSAVVLSLGVLVVAPSTASAAKLWVAPGPDGGDRVYYQAGAREVNRPAMLAGTGEHGFSLPFFEYGAPLHVGDGCEPGTPVLCGFLASAEVRLGDKNDVASINSHFSEVEVYGDAGHDDLLSGGVNAVAYGGDGDDTMRLAASGAVEAFGGIGSDRIAGGLGSSFDTFDGGSGNDLLVPSANSESRASGGDGADEIVAAGRSVTVSGGAGADVIVITAAAEGPQVNGDGGNDVIDLSATPGTTLDAGSGADWIDAHQGDGGATPDTITCGPGLDILFMDAGDSADATCETRLTMDILTHLSVTLAKQHATALLAHLPDPSDI